VKEIEEKYRAKNEMAKIGGGIGVIWRWRPYRLALALSVSMAAALASALVSIMAQLDAWHQWQ
jgi:hypothetical protein